MATLKGQLASSEAEVARLRDLVEMTEKNANAQLEDLRCMHQREKADLRRQHEEILDTTMEREVSTYHGQLESLREELAAQVAAHRDLEREHRRQLDDIIQDQRQTQHSHAQELQRLQATQAEELAQAKASARHQVAQLEQKLSQAESLRKTQLTELGVLRDQEKESEKRQHRQQIDQLIAGMEADKVAMEKRHSEAMVELFKKTDGRVEQIKADYNARETRLLRDVANLELKLQQAEASRLAAERNQRAENALDELRRRLEKETHLRQHLEQQLKLARSQNKENIAALQLRHAEELRDLLPRSLKDELESTIAALKEQCQYLQQRLDAVS
eukprot:m.163499 g.163499  ORF g.163499 m.163499 type:complete len:331 (-) comp17691_c0_seq4:55-1047(-)